MNKCERWTTKADMLKDLAEVNGGLEDIDDSFIIRGEKPPPSRFDGEDEEIKLRFGNICESDNAVPPPDLQGIAQMLQMLKDVESDDDDFSPMRASEHNIVISKLNPEVPEFVPNSVFSSPGNKCGNVTNSAKTSNVSKSNGVQNHEATLKPSVIKKNGSKSNKTNYKDTKNDPEILKRSPEINVNEIIDISELNAEEIKDITMQLRNKISIASKKDDLKLRREKNVAIAALLKMYSTPPASQQKTAQKREDDSEEKPIKLFTPEYFETCPAITITSTDQVIGKVHGVAVNGSDSNLSVVKHSLGASKSSQESIASPTISQTIVSEVDTESKDPKNEITIKPKLNVGSPTENLDEIDHYIKKSIEIVNDWHERTESPASAKSKILPKSPKPKGPAVYLGPVSFKKKTIAPKSPVSDGTKSRASTTSGSEISQIEQYKPSAYANDLSKKFMEQGKALENRQQDMWTRLEMQMKEKEKQMKIKREQSSLDGIDDTEKS